MVENKTQATDADVIGFLEQVKDDRKREDSFAILEMMSAVTGEEAKMWGPSIIGFGDVHLRYGSGREVDFFKVGFSPRKASISLYLPNEFDDRDRLLADLGEHTTGKSCVYIKRLEDIDRQALVDLIGAAVRSAS
jgi:hypothetical protein